MTDVIQTFASVIQTVAVIISLVYVAKQIQDSTKSVKSQTYQAIISSYAEIEARISQDAETAALYKLGCEKPSELSEEQSIRFTQLVCSIFNFFENLHYQFKSELLEAGLWAGWCLLMQEKLESPGIKIYWKKNQYLYSLDFQKYVESKKCPRN